MNESVQVVYKRRFIKGFGRDNSPDLIEVDETECILADDRTCYLPEKDYYNEP